MVSTSWQSLKAAQVTGAQCGGPLAAWCRPVGRTSLFSRSDLWMLPAHQGLASLAHMLCESMHTPACIWPPRPTYRHPLELQLGTQVPGLPAGEDSYSHHVDMDVGLAVIDRFTFFLLNFFEGIRVGSRATMAQLFDSIRSGTALCLCPHCRQLSTCVK